MKKAQRLKGKKDFDRVFSDGRTWAGSLIVLKAVPNGLDISRYGILVGRGMGRAVARNRVKRQLRTMVPDAAGDGWDVVLIARKSAAETDYHTLERATRELFARAKLQGEDKRAE